MTNIQFFGAVSVLVPLIGSAQPNVPTVGLLHHTTEQSSLAFDCNLLQNGRLHCEFVQTWIRRDLPDDKIAARRQEFMAQFSDAVASSREEGGCDELQGMVDIATGKKPAPDPKAFDQMSAREVANLTALAELSLAFCQSPTRENYAALIDASLDREQRTCRVGGLSFEQTFVKAPDTDAWLVDTGAPVGPCGIVQLSRFEPGGGGEELAALFWNYVARKAVTNPNASSGLVPCSDLDEETYDYSWRSKDHFMQCDVIRFSAF